MTEEEWVKCESSIEMLEYLDGKANERKARLFACACCRRIGNLFTDKRLRKALEVAEDYPADFQRRKGAATSVQCIIKLMGIYDPRRALEYAIRGSPRYKGDVDFAVSAAHRVYDATEDESEIVAQCALLRDIFGNPFNPVALDPRWLTGTVVDLATVIYQERALDRMLILGDALQDAGCDNDEIIAHCRGPGPHVRGCWAVDLLLGKE